MNENLEESVTHVFANPEVKEGESFSEGSVEMLKRAEAVDLRFKNEISDKYGYGFYKRIQDKISLLSKDFFYKGEVAIDWVEAKGLPLPTSKLGMQAWSAATGVVAVIVPGLGVLLPVAYILWKRSQDREGISSNEIKPKYV